MRPVRLVGAPVMLNRRALRPLETLEDRLTPTGVPLIDSWMHGSPGEYAQVINGFNVAAGPSTTWPNYVPPGGKYSGGNFTPALGDAQKVSSSASWVYLQASGLASYVMGPWHNADGSVFPNF